MGCKHWHWVHVLIHYANLLNAAVPIGNSVKCLLLCNIIHHYDALIHGNRNGEARKDRQREGWGEKGRGRKGERGREGGGREGGIQGERKRV